MKNMDEIVPIAIPGTHQRFLAYFKKLSIPVNSSILDVGAGHGAFTKQLFEMDYRVSACDLFPEIFRFDKVECKKVDITSEFPYDDNSFDHVLAIEVTEHIIDHEMFFKEILRILKPGGSLFISTPNILSIKSRLRFLFRGFFYSFNELDHGNHDGLQHVTARTIDQYTYIAKKHGFNKITYEVDKLQSTSRVILPLIYPIIFLGIILKRIPVTHNRIKLLLGRILFVRFQY